MDASATKPIRVVVVDDTEGGREGVRALLHRAPDIAVVHVLSFEAALGAGAELWTGCDVALVDGGDEEADDQMPGPTVAALVKLVSPNTKVAIVTEHYRNDGMRLRARHAKADGMQPRQKVTRSSDRLCSFVREIYDQPPNLPDVDWFKLLEVGISDRTPVNDVVQRVGAVLSARGLEFEDLWEAGTGDALERKGLTRDQRNKLKALLVDRLDGVAVVGARNLRADEEEHNMAQIRKVIALLTRLQTR